MCCRRVVGLFVHRPPHISKGYRSTPATMFPRDLFVREAPVTALTCMHDNISHATDTSELHRHVAIPQRHRSLGSRHGVSSRARLSIKRMVKSLLRLVSLANHPRPISLLWKTTTPLLYQCRTYRSALPARFQLAAHGRKLVYTCTRGSNSRYPSSYRRTWSIYPSLVQACIYRSPR